MLKCLIALISLFSVAALAAPAWTWVDDQGRRHYSDRPVDGATQIELAGPQTFTGGSTAATPAPAVEAPPPAPPQYSVLDIVSPANEATVNNTGGMLTVDVAVYPALRAAHRIDVILDGQRQALGSRGLSVTIPDVVRGEHTVQALILDADGQELMRSETVTVFVRQASLLTPPPQRAPTGN